MKTKKLTALLLILTLCCALLSVTALARRIETPEDAFTYEEYESADSVRVTVTVSNDTETEPKVAITVNYYGNIK